MERLIFVVTIVLLLVMSIADGARNQVASTTLSIAIEILLLVYLLVCFNSTNCRLVLNRYRWIWLCLILWIGVTLVQCMALFGYENYHRYASFQELNLYIGYVGFLLLMLCLLHNVKRIKIVFGVLVLVAVLQTVFGLANYYSGETPMGWRPTHWAAHRVTGTFVNRNFYANYIVMCMGFVIMPLVLKPVSGKSAHNPSGEKLNRQAIDIFYMGVAILLFAGLLLSGSRGGISAFVVGLVGALIVARLRKNPGLRIGRLFIIAFLGVALFGIDLLKSRFSNVVVDGSARLEQWKATTELIMSKWFAGYGPGSYEIAYKAAIPITSSPLTHNHAHSDYLEILLEQGVLGGLLMAASITMILYFAVVKIKSARSHSRGVILLSALFGIISMLCHGIYDFPFQVPSNMVLFLTLISILLAAEHLSFRSNVVQR